MTVKQTLKSCILLYPTIFKNKWDVYHHLFIVNGNGYAWKKGELVSSEKDAIPTIEEAIEKHFEFHLGNRKLIESPLIWSVKACKDNILLTLQWEKRMKDFTCDRKKIYPICEFSKLLNIPKNISTDWRNACNEMISWLVGNPELLSADDLNYINKLPMLTEEEIRATNIMNNLKNSDFVENGGSHKEI